MSLDETREAGGPVSKDASLWPEASQLEKWLMFASQGGDRSAQILRKVLLMNPAYGAYMMSDEDLSEIAMAFAKRMRTKIMTLNGPMTNMTLMPDLCEAIWRTVGYVLHTILVLEDNQALPLPEMATGQVRMLLRSNEELSRQFNRARSQWLKELSNLRDQQRRISARAQRALDSLQEEPIYFYEPLSYFLDDTTKEFIGKTVEERIKMEMKRAEPQEDQHQLMENARQLEELERHLRSQEAEMRRLRNDAAKFEAEARRFEDQLRRLKMESDQARKNYLQKEQEVENLTAEIEALRAQLAEKQRRIAALENAAVPEGDGQAGLIKELQDEIDRQSAEAARNAEEAARLQRRVKELEEQMSGMSNKPAATEPVVVKEKEIEERVVVEEKVVERIVTADDPELSKKLEQYVNIEKELRQANKELEKALKEEKELTAKLQAQLKDQSSKPAKEKPVKQVKTKEVPAEKDDSVSREQFDKDIQDAIAKVTEKHEKLLREQAEEIERLKDELRRLRNAPPATPEKPPKEPKEPKQKEVVYKETVNVEEETRLRQEISNRDDTIQQLKDEISTLEQQVKALMDKLQEVGGSKAVAEMKEKFKAIKPAKPKKPRKKTAFERLWDDAMRRLSDMRARQAQIEKKQEIAIIRATAYVRDKRSLHEMVNLTHLQKASAATAARFNEAYQDFVSRNEANAPETLIESGDEPPARESPTNAYARAAVAAATLQPLSSERRDRSGGSRSGSRGKSPDFSVRELSQEQLDVCKALLRQEEFLMEHVLLLSSVQVLIDKFLAGQLGDMVIGKSLSDSPKNSPSSGRIGQFGAYSTIQQNKTPQFFPQSSSPDKFASAHWEKRATPQHWMGTAEATQALAFTTRRLHGVGEISRALERQPASPPGAVVQQGARGRAPSVGIDAKASGARSRSPTRVELLSNAPWAAEHDGNPPRPPLGSSGMRYERLAPVPDRHSKTEGTPLQHSASDTILRRPPRANTTELPLLGDNMPWSRRPPPAASPAAAAPPNRSPSPGGSGGGGTVAAALGITGAVGTAGGSRRTSPERRPPPPGWSPPPPGRNLAGSAGADSLTAVPGRVPGSTLEPLTILSTSGLAAGGFAAGGDSPVPSRQLGATGEDAARRRLGVGLEGVAGGGGSPPRSGTPVALGGGLDGAQGSVTMRPGQLQEVPFKASALSGKRILASSAPVLGDAVGGEVVPPIKPAGALTMGGGATAAIRQLKPGEGLRNSGKFLVTPMVSQQSISAGLPMPWEQ